MTISILLIFFFDGQIETRCPVVVVDRKSAVECVIKKRNTLGLYQGECRFQKLLFRSSSCSASYGGEENVGDLCCPGRNRGRDSLPYTNVIMLMYISSEFFPNESYDMQR